MTRAASQAFRLCWAAGVGAAFLGSFVLSSDWVVVTDSSSGVTAGGLGLSDRTRVLSIAAAWAVAFAVSTFAAGRTAGLSPRMSVRYAAVWAVVAFGTGWIGAEARLHQPPQWTRQGPVWIYLAGIATMAGIIGGLAASFAVESTRRVETTVRWATGWGLAAVLLPLTFYFIGSALIDGIEAFGLAGRLGKMFVPFAVGSLLGYLIAAIGKAPRIETAQ